MSSAAVETDSGAPGFVDRVVMFVQALRRAEVPVSTAESVDATRAIGVIDLLDREGLRATLAATMCTRPAYRQTFDGLFELYSPARLGDGLTTSDEELDSLDAEGLGIDPE